MMTFSSFKIFFTSRSPNPFKIYPKVFMELTKKLSKPQKRSLSNTQNWGKRSDKVKDPLYPSTANQLENSFIKRIWQEAVEPISTRPADKPPESSKDDVFSFRISGIWGMDVNRRFLYNLFPDHGPLLVRSSCIVLLQSDKY